MIHHLLFTAVLIYAAAVDVRTKTVPTHVLVLLLLIGVMDIRPASFKGFVCAFIPLFFTAMVSPAFGGGDVKFGSLCGFVMGVPPILYALLLGLLACTVLVTVYCKIKRLPAKGTGFPLVPFLAFGCLIVELF